MPSARSHIRTINQFGSPHENGLCKKLRGLCEFWDGNGGEDFFFSFTEGGPHQECFPTAAELYKFLIEIANCVFSFGRWI
jgi:hypothetical protein